MAQPQPIRTIVVIPNPYSGIAPDGVPQGVVTMPGTRNYIGAHLDRHACLQTGKSRFYYAAPQDGETGIQGLRKVTVPFTAEIARAVLEGGLIVVEKDHGRACGLGDDDHRDADAQLTAERDKALAFWRAHHGDDATLEAFPVEPTADPAVSAAPPPKAAPVDPRSLPILKGTPLAGPANNPSLVIRPAPEGA